jgi:hypothetical protein
MAKTKETKNKKTPAKAKEAPAKATKGVTLVTRSHRDTAEGTWTDAPEDPVVVGSKDAVVVQTVVIQRTIGKQEKRPHFMSDLKN